MTSTNHHLFSMCNNLAFNTIPHANSVRSPIGKEDKESDSRDIPIALKKHFSCILETPDTKNPKFPKISLCIVVLSVKLLGFSARLYVKADLA
jgi:hypothetical protein